MTGSNSRRRPSPSPTSSLGRTSAIGLTPPPLRIVDPAPLDPSPVDPSRPQGTFGGTSNITSWLIKTQRLSSYAFTGFLGLHFTTTGIIPSLCTIDSAENSLLLARVLYQSPYVERTLVLGSLVIHVMSGMALRAYRIKQRHKRYGSISVFANMTRVSWTGYMLVPFIGIHYVLMRALPVEVLGGSEETGLRFAAHGIERYPLFSIATYSLLLVIGGVHMVQGWYKWLQPTRRWRRSITCSAFGAGLVWASSLFFLGRIGASQGYLGKRFDMVYSTFFNGEA